MIELINQSLSEQKNDVLQVVEEKFERRLSEEISGLEVRLSEKISRVETDLSEKISRVETDISEKITEQGKRSAEYKADLIKWMFIFWVGQVGVILGILFAFFK